MYYSGLFFLFCYRLVENLLRILLIWELLSLIYKNGLRCYVFCFFYGKIMLYYWVDKGGRGRGYIDIGTFVYYLLIRDKLG